MFVWLRSSMIADMVVILCLQVVAELAPCRECKAVSVAEWEELVLKVLYSNL